jgi:UDP-glucose 4-epimerase
VTGGAGFIGSHVCERLLADGHSVTALDDLSGGRRENLAGVFGRPAFSFREGSAADDVLVAALTADADAVLHLAAAVGVRRVVEEPVATILANLRGTEVVLAACAARGLPVLLTSSSEVYGRGTRAPFREDDDLLLGPSSRGRWSYAAAKLAGEHLALAWHRERGLPVRVVRVFNTSGPRQRGDTGMVLPRFVAAALAGEPLLVHGDGTQTRTFCHVADTVEAFLRLLEAPEASGAVVNVGGSEEIAIGDLAERVLSVTGSRSPVRRIPHAEVYGPGFDDLPRRVPDVSRLRALTGFTPTRTLDSLLAETAAALRGERARAGTDAPGGGIS